MNTLHYKSCQVSISCTKGYKIMTEYKIMTIYIRNRQLSKRIQNPKDLTIVRENHKIPLCMKDRDLLKYHMFGI